MNNLLDGIKL